MGGWYYWGVPQTKVSPFVNMFHFHLLTPFISRIFICEFSSFRPVGDF